MAAPLALPTIFLETPPDLTIDLAEGALCLGELGTCITAEFGIFGVLFMSVRYFCRNKVKK